MFPFPVCRICAKLLTAIFLLSALAAWADDTDSSWRMRVWQSDDGLPDNTVVGLAQGSDGYLWIGTPSGLARFDGIRFEGCSLTNIIESPNRGVLSLIPSRSGGLWLAMDRGAIVHLNGSSSQAYLQDLPDVIPNGLAEDVAGDLLAAYRSGLVYEISKNRVIPLTAGHGLPEGIDLCALTTDRQGRIWFGKSGQVGVFTNGVFHVICQVNALPMRLVGARDGGVWICSGTQLLKCDQDGKLEDFGHFHPESSGTLSEVLLEDHEGTVWIGTSFSGLFRHGPAGFESVPTSHQRVESLLEDTEGDIWAGTMGGGLDRIQPRSITLEGVESGLPFSSIESICQDTNGVIWAVTQNGVLARKTGERWESIPVDTNWPGNATCVTADSQGAIWIGTRLRGLYCWRDGHFVSWGDASQLEGKTLHTLLASKAGDLWIGQESPAAMLCLHQGHLQTFEAPPDSRIIRAMAEDADGNIWGGTSKGTLLQLTDHGILPVSPRPAHELASIRCLYATPDGALWIGYAGWGLGCLRAGRYSEINTERGLLDDYISHIVADEHGCLWFASNRGLFKVRIQDLKNVIAGRASRIRSVHYGRGEGLPSLQGTFGGFPDVLRSTDGRLWIPMQTALVVVDPTKENQKPQAPPTLLTRVVLDDRVIARYSGILPLEKNAGDNVHDLSLPNLTLHLPPGHRRIEFDFSAFSFQAPENVQFRYQLKGLDDDWVEAGAYRQAGYAQLSSGDYRFEVTACNNDGDWNQEAAEVGLTVSPFFWQSWWFRLTVLAAFTMSIIAVVRYVSFRRLQKELRALAQLAALQKERARIAKDIHDDLGANLTQIAFLGELVHQDRGEPERVAERIGKISWTARQAIKSLDEIVWAVNPRNDTLAHLIDYAGQFALDYLRLAGIRCRLDFPAESPTRELSTDLRHNLFLVIKESLHNIVKHAGATEVWVRVVLGEDALEVVVEDNGRGFDNAPDDALADGLRNMKQRMADIGGDFRVESQPGHGTKIHLRLPWHKD